MFRPGLGKIPVGPPLHYPATSASQHDERPLSISANGAYYLIRARLREIGVALSVSIQAQGGVDVPSPEKHR